MVNSTKNNSGHIASTANAIGTFCKVSQTMGINIKKFGMFSIANQHSSLSKPIIAENVDNTSINVSKAPTSNLITP